MIRAWRRERQRKRARIERPRWMTIDEYEQSGLQLRPRQLHTTVCHRTLEIYVRPYDRRFRGLSRRELQNKYDELQHQALALSGKMMDGLDGMPLRRRVEFLDSALEFELSPPCGCVTHITQRAALA